MESKKEDLEKNEEEINKTENEGKTKEEKTKEKVDNILKKAKEKGKITYGELATELSDSNQEQMEQVFDAIEEMGMDLLKDDFDDEPNEEDLAEVEDLKIEEVTPESLDGINGDVDIDILYK